MVFLNLCFPFIIATLKSLSRHSFLITPHENLTPQVYHISNYCLHTCALYRKGGRIFHFLRIEFYLLRHNIAPLIMPDKQELKRQKQTLFSRSFTYVAVCCHEYFKACSLPEYGD